MAISPLDYILQGARKILDKGQEAFRGDIGAVVGNQSLNATKTGIAINTALGLPKAAKEMLLPTRGYTEQQLKQAKPTAKEKILAIPKIGAEIASIGKAFGGARGLQQFASTDIGGKLADVGTKISDFAKPKTAGEAAAMRIADVVTLFPVGSLKISTTGASTIAKTKNLNKIKTVLKAEIPKLSDEAAEAFGRVLVGVDKVDDVQKVINRTKFQLQKATPVADDITKNAKAILETGKPMPVYTNKGLPALTKKTPSTPVLPSKLPPVASKVGSEAKEFIKAQGTRTGVEVRDKIGTKLQDPYTAEYLPTNSDGTITLYHSTTKEGAEKIKQSGIFGSKTEGGDIYFTTNKKGYGGIGKDKDVVLAFNVDPKKIKFDDVYRGELHLKGNNTDIGGIKPVVIKTKSQLIDIWNKAQEVKGQAKLPSQPIKELQKTQIQEPELPQVVGQQSSYKPTLPQQPKQVKVTPAKINKVLFPKAEKITRREDVLLREKFRQQAKGAKEGFKAGMEEGYGRGEVTGFFKGAKEGVRYYKKEQAFLKSIQNQIARELSKPKGLQRSAISFVKQLGEFNQTVMGEIKKELGITKPLKEMNLGELNDFTTKLKERLKFKQERGYRPSGKTVEKLSLKETEKPVLTETDYITNRELSKSPSFGKKLSQVARKTGLGTEKVLAPISTRLENIDPSLKTALRKFEFNVGNALTIDKKAISPYLKKIKTGLFNKMSKEDFADLDLALKNGDTEMIGIINKKYGLEKEYAEVKATLDNIYKRANEVGFDIGYKKDYWPRMIKDVEGFLEYFGKQEYWSVLNKAIEGKEMELGRLLSAEERANLINTMIRGYQGGQITLSGTGAMEKRIIDLVTPELNKFYDDSGTSLVKYVSEINDKIEARKFFGKSGKEFNNLEDSIGNYTNQLIVDGKITPKQELELRGMLNARFNPKGTHGLVGLYKNIAYIDTLGSPLNAITQLGDLAWPIYQNGLWRTAKALGKSLVGKSKITKEMLGLEANSIASEFADAGKVAKTVDKVLSMTGLNKIDKLGKTTLINSSIEKYRKLATSPTKEFTDKMNTIFGKEAEAVINDLRNGEITENVKFLAFNDVLDFNPVALSEMPEEYLRAGNGRILYMLKSYTIKQFDIFRREAFREMAKGNVLKGIKNLIYLTALLVIVNGTADEIKDTLTGRKTSLKDRTIDQLVKLVGFSRYSAGRISKDGLGSVLMEQVTPPANFLNNLSEDLINLYTDFDESASINKLKTVQNIPIGGKLYYWWFGKGVETKEFLAGEKKIKTEKELAQEVLNKLKSGEFGSEAVAEEYLNAELKKIETAKKKERMELPPQEYAQELLNLLKAGKMDEATAEKELNSYLKQENTPDRTTSYVKNRGSIGLILDYGKAFTIDPGNAWKALTTDEKLGIVEGNLVELARFKLKDYNKEGGSEEYKEKAMQKLGIPLSEKKNYKLEHIVPVKAGGDTSANNLLIVTNAEHNAYTDFDVASAKAVQDKKTTRKKVAEIAIKLKIDKTISVEQAINMLQNG